MIKRLLLILVLMALILLGLQLFGGRDFTQIGYALEKYQAKENFSVLMDDIGDIFMGRQVSQAEFYTGKHAQQKVYQWVDENGEVHYSERPPEAGQYITLEMNDLIVQVQKTLTRDDIKEVINIEGFDSMSSTEQRYAIERAVRNLSPAQARALQEKLEQKK
ncbi:DUF4124 domain-containing protein [Aliikangiella sp. G2MR2-5]|uniref:DUF4124 domain-containing protein n=1 Tax=Aliikangiella sp. G2MR2-5 TaxID=2788943 RepID=UPI0018AC4BBD|nr:DUF4124 domain-containing protein [Aliikangiella sp. G2MR2-5]